MEKLCEELIKSLRGGGDFEFLVIIKLNIIVDFHMVCQMEEKKREGSIL